jgi:hypothetical protein
VLQNIDALYDLEIITKTTNPQDQQAWQDACAVASCCHTMANNYEDNCYAEFNFFGNAFTACNLLKDGTPDIPTLNINADASTDNNSNGSMNNSDGNSRSLSNSSPPPLGILEPSPGNFLRYLCDPSNTKSPVLSTVGQCEG